MQTIIHIFAALCVLALAYWANLENYKTKTALDEVRALEDDIGRMREEIIMLRAEWAYLNRPERLRQLVDMNFDRLGLVNLQSEQFGWVDQISYPALQNLSESALVAADQEAN